LCLWEGQKDVYFMHLYTRENEFFTVALIRMRLAVQACKGNCDLKKKCLKALKCTGRGSEEERMGIALLAWSNIRTDM